MKNNLNIKKLIQLLADQGDEIYSIYGTVTYIDNDNRTVTVSPLNDDPDILGVRTQAYESSENGLFIEPVMDSVVCVSFIDVDNAFISLYSDIQNIYLNISEDFIINDGSNGGLIKINDLVSKINTIENKVNSLVQKFNSHIHVTTATIGAGPTVGVLSPTITPEVGSIINTNVQDIENERIQH